MRELVFTVCKQNGAWLVRAPFPIGPLHSRDQALDLAEGMAAALSDAGEKASVVLLGSDQPIARLQTPCGSPRIFRFAPGRANLPH